MIKAKITDQILIKHLKEITPDGKDIFLLEDNQVRATVLGTTELINQVRVNFNLDIAESYTLGESYIAAALLASTVKGNDRIQLSIDCGGLCGGVYTEAWASGAVRGYLKNNHFGVEEKYPVNTDPIYGPGFLSVSKILEGSKSPFKGQTMLQSGKLSEDLKYYFLESEQTESLFVIDFNVDENNRIMGAGGIFLQLLPGSTDKDLMNKLAEKINNLPSIAKAISEGINPSDYIKDNFENSNHLQHSLIGFSCPCDKKTFAKHLSVLKGKDRDDIKKNGPFPLELVCLNCNSKYKFEKEELQDLLK